MSNITSKSHFAKMCGVSRAAITKASDAGNLGLIEGKINLDHRLTKEYLNDKKGNPTVKAAPIKKTVKKKTPAKEKPSKKKTPIEKKIIVKKPEAPEAPEEPKLIVRSLDEITAENLFLLEKKDIDKFKSYEQALMSRQNRDTARGILITRVQVRRTFAKLFTIDTNQIKTQEDRLAADICGLFGMRDGCKQSVLLRKLIADDGVKILRNRKRIIDDFLASVKADPI